MQQYIVLAARVRNGFQRKTITNRLHGDFEDTKKIRRISSSYPNKFGIMQSYGSMYKATTLGASWERF